MTVSFSKFISFFTLVLFLFCYFLSQKTVAIKYRNSVQSYLTHERTVEDVLRSHHYPNEQLTTNKKVLNQFLQEGMVIEILSDHTLKIIE